MHPKDIPLKFEKIEIFFRTLLRLVAAGYVLAALVYVWVGVQSPMTQLAPPMLTATLVTKVLLLALLALTAAGNIRYARVPVYLLIAANLITALIALVLWQAGILAPPMSLVTIPELYIPAPAGLGGVNSRLALSHPQTYDTAQMLQGSVIYDIVVCVVAYYLQWRVEKTQYRFCKFLQPVEYDVVYALADVLIHDGTSGKRERLTPADIANNVDQFLHDFPGKRTSTLAMAVRLMEYLPFIWNFATFSYLNAADRRATLEGHFIRSQRNWRLFHWFRPFFRRFRRTSRRVENRFRRWMQRIRNVAPYSTAWISVINIVTAPIWLLVWVITFIPNTVSLWRFVIRGLITSVKQLVYTGYYQDRTVQAEIGYVAPSQRITSPLIKTAPSVNVITGRQFSYGDWLAAKKTSTEPCNNSPDNPVIIIGTGAAASIIAYYLVQQKWHVLMLERGPYISPAQFSENEVEGSSKLYADGLLQISTNLQLQVAQGRCVGGGTTVNNGICFAPPADIIADWHNRMGGQLDVAQFDAAIAEVENLLQVQSQRQNLNPSGELFVAGVKLAEGAQAEAPTVAANIEDCMGCGLCNTGCRYDRKKSALIWLLPKASQTGRLTIISDCEVTRINTRKSDKGENVTGLECAITGGGQLRLSGCAYIVSAGAIASSVLLQRSGLGGSRVGKGVSFNVGAIMTGRFDREVNAYAGLQMSHTYSKFNNGKLDYMLETWFNPPVTQATRMPGWFEDHFNNMKDYTKMMSIGVLVGSAANNVVMNLASPTHVWQSMKLLWHGDATFWELVSSAVTGSNLVFKADRDDVARILSGLRLAGKVMLKAGATSVMPSTFHYMGFSSENALDQALTSDNVRPRDLLLASAHPQGGNALSADVREGVVAPDFRVHGVNNLFVCDASVFPTSVKVNPQLAIMGLAQYAVKHQIAPALKHL